MFKVEKDHEPIITQETFDAVQAEKRRRSNIVKDETGTHRSSQKYSAKDAVESEANDSARKPRE